MKRLETDGLVRHFDGVAAVDGVSLAIEPGAFVGLIGPNGSGKTTLFNLITGMLKADRGRIRLDGEPIEDLAAADVFARGIGRTFQIPRLFYGMSVLENVLVAARDQRGERLRAALRPRTWRAEEIGHAERALDLLDFLSLGGLARRRATDLSGGQMKLLELARALIAEPQVLLLDEPAAGVLPSLARDIFARLAAHQRERGLTLIVIEHRLDILFDYVDRVLVMHQGRVIADGAPDRVSGDLAVQAAYFGSRGLEADARASAAP